VMDAIVASSDEYREVPWFYRIEDTPDPWRNWLSHALRCRYMDYHGPEPRPPLHSPFDAALEHHIEDMCWAADRRRLAIVPSTKHFAEIWATFRRHHEWHEGDWDYRRNRFLIWRTAALKVTLERGWGQDSANV
jgi:hypothetical protein